MDVSVVLNVHKESIYLLPTLRSLSAAADYALSSHISVEIIAVLDNSDETTQCIVDDFAFSAFSDHRISRVEFNSLSLSRNFGIELASGKYVLTADAGDLMSKNLIADAFFVAQSSPQGSAFFAEYLIAFGEQYYVAKFKPSSELILADFINQNMFTSQLFIARDLINRYLYRVINSQPGYAFEDWDLTNRLYADGIELNVVGNTVLFHRTKKEEFLCNKASGEEFLVPRSKIHQCDFLIKEASDKFAKKSKKQNDYSLAWNIYHDLNLKEFIYDAITHEPTMLIDLIGSSLDLSPRTIQKSSWASGFIQAVKMIQNCDFTDIVLLQSLNHGGAEKYIFQILRSIQAVQHDAKILLIALEGVDKHNWLSAIGKNWDFIDLKNSFPYLTDDELSRLLISLILCLKGDKARLHLKTFSFGHNFLIKFKTTLASNFQIIYYRFSDSTFKLDSHTFRDGHIIGFLRKTLDAISHVITDNSSIIKSDKFYLGAYNTKKYVKINIGVYKAINTWKPDQPKFKILWASRISAEKRPELIPLILQELTNEFPNLEIDVYGTNQLPNFIEELTQVEGINYFGQFEEFEKLPINNYDMLLYTSLFDGMPNILLEAIASGIPIVAPNVGGIIELSEEGLFLVENESDDLKMARSYKVRIGTMYRNWSETLANSEKLKMTVSKKFSKDNQQKTVLQTFFTGIKYESQ